MPLNMIIGVSNIVVGLLFIALCRPLVQGRIKPNRWYGVRLPKAYESDANWYAINRYGGKRLIFWSFVLITLGLLCLLVPLRSDSFWAFLAGIAPALMVLIPTIEIYLYSKTL